jgi:hypothetical protein
MSVDLAISLLLALINNAQGISSLITKAKAENRDITPEELQGVIDSDAVARANLVLAIAKAKGM